MILKIPEKSGIFCGDVVRGARIDFLVQGDVIIEQFRKFDKNGRRTKYF